MRRILNLSSRVHDVLKRAQLLYIYLPNVYYNFFFFFLIIMIINARVLFS